MEWLVFLSVCVILILFLYDKFPSFRYRLKFLFFAVSFGPLALYISLRGLRKPRDVHNWRFGVSYMRKVSRLLGIKWEICGEDILTTEYPCVLLCNHQTLLDFIGMLAMYHILKGGTPVAKKEVFYILPMGLMTWMCGTIFVDRRNSAQSHEALNTSADRIRENNIKLWIFPEGTRSKKKDLLPFKKGAFHLAVKNKLPIVPMVISPYSFIDFEKKVFGSGTMKVKVLNRIETSNLQYPDDVGKLAATCHELMNLEFHKLSEQVSETSKILENSGNKVIQVDHTCEPGHSECETCTVGIHGDRYREYV